MSKYLNVYMFILSLPLTSLYSQVASQDVFVNKGIMVIDSNIGKSVVTRFNFNNQGDATIKSNGEFYVEANYENQANFLNNGKLHIKANYKNNGNVTHDYEGTTFFQNLLEETNKKKIEAGNSTFLYNVVFDSPISDPMDNAAFDLSGDINIEGTATFISGILNNRAPAGSVIFWENSSTLGANNDSYINGMVEKVGEAPFTHFPIGSYEIKRYRFVGVSAPSSVNHSVTAEYFLENSNYIYPHNRKEESISLINNQEYWEISGCKNLTLTLSWDEDTTPIEFLDNPQNIRIVRWSNAESKWVNYGGIPNEINKTVHAVVKGEGIFTLALIN